MRVEKDTPDLRDALVDRSFHQDAKQSLGLDEYQVRRIKDVRPHIAMAFFAYIVT
jgi:hypothetical protein